MIKRLNTRQRRTLDYLVAEKSASVQVILEAAQKHEEVARITINRDLKQLMEAGLVRREGKARAVRYALTEGYSLIRPLDLEEYYRDGPDDRDIRTRFNFNIFESLAGTTLFDELMAAKLQALHNQYQQHIKQLPPGILAREFERVTIELSWKSSVIEGNTYSLLETETLLKEGIEAAGKKKEEAYMLLNHKEALQLIMTQPHEFETLTLSKLETIHCILVQRLGVTRNLRKTLVGITGTNYKPLDNQFQIKEALEQMCGLINSLSSPHAKALLAMLLISYIQPFEDGNKRTSRIIGNALLLAHDSFPLPLRSIDENEYKQALLVFYEQANLYHFRRLFLEQAEFSVANYFRVKN